MNDMQKYFARILLQKKILESNGQEYEDLFTKIMQYKHNDFRQIKPRGNLGDMKNDGYIPSLGHYYQSYSPETLDGKQGKINEKLSTDFKELIKSWDQTIAVKNFNFVLNDKNRYKVYPDIELAIQNLNNEYHNIKIDSFLAHNLEEIFMTLQDSQIMSILGNINIPDDCIDFIEVEALKNVVEYLLKNQQPINYNESYKVPNFTEKIKFNKLSLEVNNLLTVASYQIGTVNDFFNYQNEVKVLLRDIFKELYNNAKNKYSNIFLENNDILFFEILDNAYPNCKDKRIQDALLSLMAIYFEACDIFEEPRNN